MKHYPSVFLALVCVGCGGPPTLSVDMPLHLEDHLAAASITGSELPANPPQPVEWRFDQPQPDWRATPLWHPPYGVPTLTRSGEGLRVSLTDQTRVPDGRLRGVIHVALPDWHRRDWADVVIRARADSASTVNIVGLGFNLRDGRGTQANPQPPFQFGGQNSPIVRDGTIHTYRLRVGQGARGFQGPWRELALVFGSEGEPGSIELLTVSVVPTGTEYAEALHGVQPVTIGERIRRTLYTHAPGRFSYRVRVPEGGRVDAALGVLGGGDSVTFRVRVRSGGDEETLLQERYADPDQWAQRSVDLARFAGRTVTLTLETSAAPPGTVAFWGAPTVSGMRASDRPNVIFYIIDGGGADQMSLYGYNRRTTPNLDKLAAEGAVFEHAYSSSLWTGPSTATFMTSLHNSVLGNFRFDALPPGAPTMAERFHDAGYPTAVFTSNPNAGLPRGADMFRDQGVDPPTGSSVELHRDFWDWRAASPGEPYWVHFQTTDVHRPHVPLAPFAGLFASTGGRSQMVRWDSTMNAWGRENDARLPSERLPWGERFAETGIDRKEYFNLYRALYDESLAHQDYQLGRLVERLRESGDWEHTLLVIAADHGVNRGSVNFVLPLADTLPPHWSTEWPIDGAFQSPIFRSSNSRVPLIFVWPGRIAGGQRLRQPVSMIDVLPTLLDLTGLPALEITQGQSLAPLLLGREGWNPRPVIFDEFRVNAATGEIYGMIEMLDGRWGASLWIGPPHDERYHRPSPLILYDVSSDPQALTLMNDARPDLVEKYTALLERQWEAHRLLAQRFTPGGRVELTAAQLETLRALGYIR